MNPQSKNICVMIAASFAVFAAAIWYSANIEKNIHYPVESGRIPVEKASTSSVDNAKITFVK